MVWAAVTANGNHQYRDLGQVVQNFQPDGALSGHYLVIIEGGNGGKALLLLELQGVGYRIVERQTMQHRLSAQGTGSSDFGKRGKGGHHQGGLNAQQAGRQGYPLSMVAS